MHVTIVACMRMHICTFVLYLVSMIFGTTIPISFNIQWKYFWSCFKAFYCMMPRAHVSHEPYPPCAVHACAVDHVMLQ